MFRGGGGSVEVVSMGAGVVGVSGVFSAWVDGVDVSGGVLVEVDVSGVDVPVVGDVDVVGGGGFVVDVGALAGRDGVGLGLGFLVGVDLFSGSAEAVCGWLADERQVAFEDFTAGLFDGPVELVLVDRGEVAEGLIAQVGVFDGPVRPRMPGGLVQGVGGVGLGLIVGVVVGAGVLAGVLMVGLGWARRVRLARAGEGE